MKANRHMERKRRLGVVMDGGLLDLRKITLGHRLSPTFTGLENMYKYAYVRNGVEIRTNERERKKERCPWRGKYVQCRKGTIVGSMYIYLMPGAIRNKLLEGPGN